MKIGIDIDNVISNSNEYWFLKAKEFKKLKGHTLVIKENATSIADKFGFDKQMYHEYCSHYVRDVNMNVAIKNKAREIIDKLHVDGHKIILITQRNNSHYSDCEEVTKSWLKKHSVYYDSIYFGCEDKGIVARKEILDLFVDDLPRNCENVSKVGIKVIMFDTPFNKSCSLYERVSSWEELYKKINDC